jgi:hypothetical protein
MSQPTFVPVTVTGAVRTVVKAGAPVIGAKAKRGAVRHATTAKMNAGTPAPNEGYAYTLAERVVHELSIAHHDAHDVATALAILASKRASTFGRAPAMPDLRVAQQLLGVMKGRSLDTSKFSGLAHSYVAQRALSDAYDAQVLVRTTVK